MVTQVLFDLLKKEEEEIDSLFWKWKLDMRSYMFSCFLRSGPLCSNVLWPNFLMKQLLFNQTYVHWEILRNMWILGKPICQANWRKTVNTAAFYCLKIELTLLVNFINEALVAMNGQFWLECFQLLLREVIIRAVNCCRVDYQFTSNHIELDCSQSSFSFDMVNLFYNNKKVIFYVKAHTFNSCDCCKVQINASFHFIQLNFCMVCAYWYELLRKLA